MSTSPLAKQLEMEQQFAEATPMRNPAKRQIWIKTSEPRSLMARRSMMMKSLPAFLVYCSDIGTEQRFDITPNITSIGRRDTNDIVLQCPMISKCHAAIEKDGESGCYFIRDLNSVNGIYINNHRVYGASFLCDGDEVIIGNIRLQFFDETKLDASNWNDVMLNHPAFANVLTESNRNELMLQSQQIIPESIVQNPAISRVRTNDDSLMGNQQLNMTGLSLADVPANIAPPRRSSDEEYSQSSHISRRSSQESLMMIPPEKMPRRDTEHRLSAVSGQKSLPLGYASQDRRTSKADKHISLVTILPSKPVYENSITVQAELDGDSEGHDFLPASGIKNDEVLKDDYEKLRLAYELSKIGLTNINDLLEKTLDLMFSVLPVDRGVILLVDRKTDMLTTDKVKLREGKGIDNKEILLSQTVLSKVLNTKKCLITIDALEDPRIGKTYSIARGGIRSVICVPLVSRNEVHGIMHFDSQDRIDAFEEKDLALVRAISNQTAIALENLNLMKDVQKEVSIRENLGRFLPPHVVEKVIKKGEEPIKRGGRQTVGTILFADIREFTRLSEQVSPQEIVDMLNDFFERLVKIVFKHGGVLDKYIGDCLMASFGTLAGQEEQAELKAVSAALEFKEAIAEINQERAYNGKEPIYIGVGLNTGDLVAGYIGSSQRLEYTCIGDTVNTASRICSMASSNQVLVSQDTLMRIQMHVEANFIGNRIFKGKSSEVAVYEVTSLHQSY